MNLPNKLTVGRLALTAIFLIVVFSAFPHYETVALVLFCLGGITDHLDGRLARKYNLITNFGILMDSLADKIMICSAFIAFVGLQLIPAWMVVVIVARELAITGLRLLAASKQVVLAAEGFGKHKTVSQIVCIIAILTMLSYQDWGNVGVAIFGRAFFGVTPWVVQFAEFSKWVAVLLTTTSGALYLWRNRQFYMQDM